MADQTFTDKNFSQEVLESKTPVLVDFWAPWCPPCHMIAPIIEDLAKEYDGKVVVGKINADENPDVIGQYGVMSLPTVMFFKNGKPVKSVIGAHGKESYKKIIEELLN